jgi:hypothetical protein
MKRLNIIIGSVLSFTAILLMTGCSVTKNTKDISYMNLRFSPLQREDFTLVGNLEARTTISGVIDKKGNKRLDKQYTDNIKEGLISKTEAQEILYFTPKEGQTITGSLYESEILNSISASASPLRLKKGGFLSGILGFFKKSTNLSDQAMAYAYYEMVNKYPEIDYVINVRFERLTTTTGAKFTETVIVKSDGINLRTDN